jgi:glycosyltransferase involved in cell wall biosynthesis
MGPRRVLYICHNHPSVRPGGAEQYALELYEAMSEEPGWEPVLVAKAGPPVSSMGRNVGTIFSRVGADHNQLFAHTDGEAYDWLMGTSRSKELYTHHFRDLLLTLQPDLVHFQHTLFFGYDLVRMVRRTLPEVPIVYTLHEYLPICHRNGQMLRTTDDSPCLEPSPRNCHACFPDISPQTFFMRKRLIQSHLSFVDRFVAPSRFLADRFIDWGIPRERILVEDYGRRGGIARDDEPDPREIRDRFGFFGQLSAFKGVTIAMEAMRLLAEDGDLVGDRCERAHLWVYGANLELQPGPFQRRFQSLLDATAAVTYEGSYQSADVGRLMSAVDWVIVPSVWWENSPLVIQEAFAARRPVICSDIGGMAEKVTEGVNGIHFRSGDPRNLAAKLRWVIETPKLWERLRSEIPDAPAMTSHVAVLQSMYEELLERRRPAPAIGAVMDASI